MRHKRLHITGCRRSGTTLLFEMLVACFEHAGHCEHEESLFKRPVPPCEDGLYISKKPSDIAHIRRIFEHDEDLHLIYVLRDPRAVITSVHPSRGDIYFASFERWQRYERAAQPLRTHPRFMEVRYEELVEDPDNVQERIQARLPFLKKIHPFSKFEQYAQTSRRAEISLRGLRPVTTDSIATWEQHLPRLQFQLQRYPALAQALIEHGYEQDDAWTDSLAGISPRRQLYGERVPPFWQRLETNLRYYIRSSRYLAARDTRQPGKKKAPEGAPVERE